MKVNNYLVTYNDLTTMSLVAKGTPATGNRIATKQFIIDNYFVDEGASPFSTYTPLRCPPYQTILGVYPSTFVTLVRDQAIQVSGDAGNTWINKANASTPEGLYVDVSMSASGQYQTVVDNFGYISYSSNYGASFVKNTAAGNRRWRCVAISRYTGQYQIAGVNGGNLANLYRSVNYGATWSVIGGFTGFWNSVAISGNGQYQLSGSSIDGYLYVSSNYGANWTAKTSLGTNWYDCFAVSGNGQYQYAYSSGDVDYPANPHTFISSDYGSNWSILSTGPSFSVDGSPPNIATNETGQYVSMAKNGTLYISSNYGASFSTIQLVPSADSITSIKMTSSGQQQVASISSSVRTVSYYLSLNYGATWTPNTTLTGAYSNIDISDGTGGTTTTSTTTTTTIGPDIYDYYLANQYDCNNPSGCNFIELVDVPVAFPAGTSYISTHYYNDISLDGKLYKITGSNSPEISVILDPTAPHGINCSAICAV
jgi:hypothetical protein